MKQTEVSTSDRHLQSRDAAALRAKRITAVMLLAICIVAAVFV
jgi:hypothetical protein